MSYTIEPLNNFINKLEKNKPKALEYIIKGDLSEMAEITVKGLYDLTDENHPYKVNVDDNVDGNIDSDIEKKQTTFTVEDLGQQFTFKFTNVYLNPNFEGTEALLKIELKDLDDNATPLEAKVFIQQEAVPSIDFFTIYPSFVNNNGEVKLSWKCSNIDTYSIHREDGSWVVSREELPPIIDGNCQSESGENALTISVLDTSKSATHIYLKASNGALVAKENNKRKIITVTKGSWRTQPLTESKELENKEHIRLTNKTLDLVGNEHESKIWALARYKKEAIRLWNSDTGADWSPVGEEKEGTNIIIEEEHLHRPALFFATSKTEPTQLYFVGGSKLDVGKCSNELVSYNLDTSKTISQRWQKQSTRSWEARAGHGCLVFPDENGNDNIWVIGGCDEMGNGLNDIHRWDGRTWHTETPPADFPKRCQFSTTVLPGSKGSSDHRKMEIWIGGGFDNDEGNPVRSIWKFSHAEGWQAVKEFEDLKIKDLLLCQESEWLMASALTNLEGRILYTPVIRDQENYSKWIQSTGRKADSDRREFDCYTYGSQDLSKPAAWAEKQSNAYYLQTLGFNGCIWLLSQRLIKGQIELSRELYYLVPEQA